MIDIAVAIFAKNPDLSPVKTRLAESIGKQQAVDFYRQSLAITENQVIQWQLSSTCLVTAYWALAEEQSLAMPEWQSFKTLWTGDGTLGQRLAQVYNNLIAKHGLVILIGSDCPDISFVEIESTLHKNEWHDDHRQENNTAIIGPSEDGGFYLFAYNGVLDKDFWNSITYSTDYTCEELFNGLRQRHISYLTLNMLSDIDNLDDLRRWQSRCAAADN